MEEYEWQPDLEILDTIRDSDIEGHWSKSVTVVGVEEIDPVTGENKRKPDPTDFTVTGLKPPFDFSYESNVFTLSSDYIKDIFPIQINYLKNRDQDSTTKENSWGNVKMEPNGGITKLETLEKSPYIVTFTVTASENGSRFESKTYKIKVIHSYTSNQLSLQEAIKKQEER